ILTADDGPQPERGPSASAGRIMGLHDVAGFEAQQRHAFYPQRGYHQLAGLTFWHRPAIFIHKLGNDELRMVVPPHPMCTLRKSRGHLRGGVGRKKPDVPLAVYPTGQCVEREVRITDGFADTKYFFYTAPPVI